MFFARILTGVGDATIWVNLVLVLGQWFTKKEFTRLVGIGSMIGNFGYLLATVPLSLLIGKVGWRPSFLMMGILLCLLGIILYIILIQRTKQSMFIKSHIQQKKTWPLLKKIFSSRQAWALFFCHFGVVGTFIGFISSWSVPFGMNVYDMTRSASSQFIMIGLIGSLIGAPILSWLSSRLNTIKKPYIVVHILLLCTWFVFIMFSGSPPIQLLYTLFFIIGFSYGSNALTFAIIRQSFPIKTVGIVTGFANAGGFLSAILLPSIFGKVLDYFSVVSNSVNDGYFYGFIIPVIFSIIGLVGVVSIYEK